MLEIANENHINTIMTFMDDAKAYLKEQRVNQWQDGYPDDESIRNDIRMNNGYILTKESEILAYSALIYGDDPSYEKIEGKWLTENVGYATIHRIAINKKSRGRGIGQKLFLDLFEMAKVNGAKSMRIDTHKDNKIMQHLLKKLKFEFCGKIYLVETGELRLAFEKIL